MPFDYTSTGLPTLTHQRDPGQLDNIFILQQGDIRSHVLGTAFEHDSNAILPHADLPLTTPPGYLVASLASQHVANDMFLRLAVRLVNGNVTGAAAQALVAALDVPLMTSGALPGAYATLKRLAAARAGTSDYTYGVSSMSDATFGSSLIFRDALGDIGVGGINIWTPNAGGVGLTYFKNAAAGDYWRVVDPATMTTLVHLTQAFDLLGLHNVGATSFTGHLIGTADLASALVNPLSTLGLAELQPVATGTNNTITVASGIFIDTNGLLRLFAGTTCAPASVIGHTRYFALAVTNASVLTVLYGTNDAGPETIVTTGYVPFAVGYLPAGATIIAPNQALASAGQGYLITRVFGGAGSAGGGGSTYSDANVVTLLSGTGSSGSALSLISGGTSQGTLADALSAMLGFDPRSRVTYSGATVQLIAGTNLTGLFSPMVLTVGPSIYKVTGTLTATASGASGVRFIALDWSAANGQFVLVLLTANSPSNTQLVIGQCYYDTGAPGGAAIPPGSVVFDFALMIGSRQVAMETYHSQTNSTPTNQLSGAGKITPAIVTGAAQFWVGTGCTARVVTHARGLIAYAGGVAPSATSGFLLVSNVKNGFTTNSPSPALGTDYALCQSGAPGLFTVDPYEDITVNPGWNSVAPMATITDATGACTVSWYELRTSVQLYAAGGQY